MTKKKKSIVIVHLHSYGKEIKLLTYLTNTEYCGIVTDERDVGKDKENKGVYKGLCPQRTTISIKTTVPIYTDFVKKMLKYFRL